MTSTALILHPRITRYRQDLQKVEQELSYLNHGVTNILVSLMASPAAHATLKEIQREAHEIAMLMCEETDRKAPRERGPTQDITEVARDLRNLIDGDPGGLDEVTQVRCKQLLQKCRVYAPRRIGDDESKWRLAQAAAKAGHVETLFVLAMNSGALGIVPDHRTEMDYLPEMIGAAQRQLAQAHTKPSFKILRCYMSQGRVAAEKALTAHLDHQLSRFSRYRKTLEEEKQYEALSDFEKISYAVGIGAGTRKRGDFSGT